MIDLRYLLTLMVEGGASDLYLTVDSSPAYRVNGELARQELAPLSKDELELLVRVVLTEEQFTEFYRTNELNTALSDTSLGRFRVNIFRQRGSVGMVIRRIRTDIPSLENLSLPNILKETSRIKRGLVLVVGATGSGKSNTLAAMIDERNTVQSGHIITVEDPIEFLHHHKRSIITQREIGVDTESYHHALKNALRQAPDVIVIGEIRDAETMAAALTFAETGHLCLATLHANSADQALERVLTFFPIEQHRQILLQLSLNLHAIISQRLLPALDGGRVPACEVLLGSARVKDLIHKGDFTELKETIEKSNTVGMQSFDQDLFRLYRNGAISLDEALRNSDSATNLRLRIKLAESETAPTPQAFAKKA